MSLFPVSDRPVAQPGVNLGGSVAVPRPVPSYHLELRYLTETFSQNSQQCGPYPEGFFDVLPRKQREYLVRVFLRLVEDRVVFKVIQVLNIIKNKLLQGSATKSKKKRVFISNKFCTNRLRLNYIISGGSRISQRRGR